VALVESGETVMAYDYKWLFESGRWRPQGLALDKADCPLAGSHVAWEQDGALKSGRIVEGATFSAESAKSVEGRLTFSGGYEAIGRFVTLDLVSLCIDIADTGADRRVVLDADTIAQLTRDIPSISSISVRFTPINALVTFMRDADGWRARTAEVTGDDLMQCSKAVSDGPVGVEVEFEVAWRWAPAAIHLLFADGAGADQLVSRPLKSDRRRVIHLAFDCAAPTHARLATPGETWTLVPAEVTGATAAPFRYALDGPTPCALDALLTESGTLRALSIDSPTLPRVRLGLTHAVDWSGLATSRYQAIVRSEEVRFDVPQAGRYEDWDYGPADPLVPGDGRPSNLVRRVKEDGSLSAARLDEIRDGQLPLAWSEEPRSYVRLDSAAAGRYGVFVTAVKYDGTAWHPLAHIAGAGIISWLGLVDTFEVTRIETEDGQRTALLFGSGFELSPRFCFAAPFGGVAMCREVPGWWAPVCCTAASSIRIDGDRWRIEGAWYWLSDDGKAARKNALALAAPFRFFWSLDGARTRSGPILSVAAGTHLPRLCGFVADELGRIDTMFGALTCELDSQHQTSFRLECGQEIPDAWPAEVKLAAIVARGSPDRSKGKAESGISWSREGLEETLVLTPSPNCERKGVFRLAGSVQS
jgi:hypothetical protein